MKQKGGKGSTLTAPTVQRPHRSVGRKPNVVQVPAAQLYAGNAQPLSVHKCLCARIRHNASSNVSIAQISLPNNPGALAVGHHT